MRLSPILGLGAFLACLFACPAWAAGSTLGSDVTAIQIYPSAQSTIYATSWASASEADFYKSTDWGLTWTFMFSTMPGLGDLAFAPSNPSVLYISAGSLPAAQVIFKSTDGGVTWNEADSGILAGTDPSTKSAIGPITVDPANEDVIYAAGYLTGLYKSTDGGQNWTSINSGLADITSDVYSPRQLMVDPSHPGTLYFSVIVTGKPHSSASPTLASGLYKSTDGGATWSATGLMGVVGGLAFDPENSSHLVACEGNKLQSSTDGGVTWRSGASGCPNSTPTLVISDTSPNQIFLTYQGSATLYLSNDGGATLSSLYTFPSELFALAYRSGSVYAGTYANGMYISRNAGATWITSGSATEPQTIHVPADQSTIQAAIDATNDGDTVLVAPGTYYEQIDFKGKAITVKSSDGAGVTILDGNNTGPIVSFISGEGNTSVLKGFTLTHAARTVSNNIGSGGAAIAMSGSPTIEDNVFVANSDTTGDPSGTAIEAVQSSAIIVRNYFVDNTGIYTSDEYSAVVSLLDGSPTLADNVFVNNSGVACFVQDNLDGDTPRVYNNTIVGNGMGFMIPISEYEPATLFGNNLIAFNQVGVQMNLAINTPLPPF